MKRCCCVLHVIKMRSSGYFFSTIITRAKDAGHPSNTDVLETVEKTDCVISCGEALMTDLDFAVIFAETLEVFVGALETLGKISEPLPSQTWKRCVRRLTSTRLRDMGVEI